MKLLKLPNNGAERKGLMFGASTSAALSPAG
jgi:hypothetical protein